MRYMSRKVAMILLKETENEIVTRQRLAETTIGFEHLAKIHKERITFLMGKKEAFELVLGNAVTSKKMQKEIAQMVKDDFRPDQLPMMHAREIQKRLAKKEKK